MIITWFHIAAFMLLFAQAPKKSLPTNIYPDWFYNPPAGIDAFSIGYSDERSYVDSAIKSATREAAVNFVKSQSVQIAGEQGMATFIAGKIPIGSTIKENYDEAEAGRLGESMKVVDWFARGRTVTVLACADSTMSFSSPRRLDATKTPKPAWVNTIPDKSGYVYSSALASVYYYENNSWREAERRARINLALTLSAKIKYLSKKLNEEYYREYQVEETNVTLHGVEIVGRWKDVKNQICYVLVRMPLGK
jgi:hypothetical protein